MNRRNLPGVGSATCRGPVWVGRRGGLVGAVVQDACCGGVDRTTAPSAAPPGMRRWVGRAGAGRGVWGVEAWEP
ncbi:hypothetical protein HNR21_001149 [Actinomadura cellulosilytica]|uniref:Uncharacterized protein n=1 Tax=Thermomonospora cellulosilytica TaxID=1411118 RepID=A0A7W3R735_9ACTN|nr:hypothetical protein [Thermomonospora cellulosilytica]